MLSRVALRSGVRSATRAIGRQGAMRAAVARPMALRSFSMTPRRLQEESSLTAADADLVATLKNEIKIEKEIEEPESPVVSKYLKDSGYQVVHKEGRDLVELVRKDGGEVVHVYFSLFDITSNESFAEEEQEGEDGQEESFDEDFDSPIRAKIVVEKPSGSLAVEATVHDDMFLIQYVLPTESAKTAIENTAEAEHERRQLYQGPVFSTLDPTVQSAIERYLETRGINSEMASFIVEYAGVRENQEYIRWLEQVQKVVEN
ncbi:hypothetical protein TRICI_001447 [Trichomonascus ciferrii]|uniref:Mitochondrial acidic protein MAM33 n=1 Tax=Trichomonascus ciferrii TaxID=44093 RepID=A0A642V9F4_9ASCO|nr:hypothetical protein TRICI_001447 [Trichomonascus ciferrii]